MSEAFHKQNDRLQEIKQALRNTMDSYREDPEKLTELLEFKSRFWNYSLNNTILIRAQNPGATFVASFRDWQEKGYHVKKGQHGLKILYPIRTELIQLGEHQFKRVSDATPEEKAKIASGELKTITSTRFGVGNVFDISQTDCPPEDYPKFYNMGYSSEQHAALYQAIKEYAQSKGIPVVETDLQSISLRGAFYPKENVIRISDKLNDTEKLSTLTHELGHALMHHNPEAMKIPTAVKELEADAISIILQKEFGIALTDSRKTHLVENYHQCLALKDFVLEDVLKDINKTYCTLRKELVPILEPITAKAQEKAVASVEQKVPEEAAQAAAVAEDIEVPSEDARKQMEAATTDLRTSQIAAVRCAVKRVEKFGRENGDAHLQDYFTDHGLLGTPVPLEEQERMLSLYRQELGEKKANRKAIKNPGENIEMSVPQYTHFYFENKYLFTVVGNKEAQKVYDRLTSEANRLGHFWSDSGKANSSDKKEAPKSALWNADKEKTAYIPFTEELYQQHIRYLEKIFAVHPDAKALADTVTTPHKPEHSQPQHSQTPDALDYIKRNVSLLTVATDMGLSPVKAGGYYSLKEHDSVRIYPDTNSYYQFSSGKGGSPIDFVMNFGGYTKEEAIRKLKEQYVGNRLDSLPPVKNKPVSPPEKKEFVLPDKTDGKYSHAYAYLVKTRCLDEQLVQNCMKSGLIYEDKKHNVVFVGKDAAGNASFATRHTSLTGSSFKRDVAGSRQDIGWMVDNKATKLYVCEAPIDALSIMSLRKQQGVPVNDASYLATCGTGKSAALYTRLKDNPKISEVILANDNDTAGKEANRKIFETLHRDYPSIAVKQLNPKHGKDINECLCLSCSPVSPKSSTRGKEVER